MHRVTSPQCRELPVQSRRHRGIASRDDWMCTHPMRCRRKYHPMAFRRSCASSGLSSFQANPLRTPKCFDRPAEPRHNNRLSFIVQQSLIAAISKRHRTIRDCAPALVEPPMMTSPLCLHHCTLITKHSGSPCLSHHHSQDNASTSTFPPFCRHRQECQIARTPRNRTSHPISPRPSLPLPLHRTIILRVQPDCS